MKLLQGRAIWILAVGILGIVAVSLIVNDPKNEGLARGLKPTYYPEPVAKPGYTLTKECIGDRKVWSYLLSSDSSALKRKPAVILIHGGAMVDLISTAKPQYKGEWFIPLFESTPYRLAEAGIVVVAIDAWWAGERFDPERAKLAKNDPMASVFRGYVETTRDVSQVIDYLVNRDDIDPERIGVAGRSGGGIITLMAACKDDRITAAVAWKAGADFVKTTQLRGQGALLNEALNENAEFGESIRREDPIYLYQKIPPKALALIGNYDDPLMPRQAAQGIYEKLRPLYAAHPERLMIKLFETPKPTHDLEPAAFELGCEWLKRFLVSPQ
ncbi:MAG: prolyl oligopeptidase family serine peptidase [Candidatus Hydrogenedentales bacterium]